MDHPQVQVRFQDNFFDDLADLTAAVRLRADSMQGMTPIYSTAATPGAILLPEFPRIEWWLGQAPFTAMSVDAGECQQHGRDQGGRSGGRMADASKPVGSKKITGLRARALQRSRANFGYHRSSEEAYVIVRDRVDGEESQKGAGGGQEQQNGAEDRREGSAGAGQDLKGTVGPAPGSVALKIQVEGD